MSTEIVIAALGLIVVLLGIFYKFTVKMTTIENNQAQILLQLQIINGYEARISALEKSQVVTEERCSHNHEGREQ